MKDVDPAGSDGFAGIRPPWSRSDRRLPRVVLRPLQEFTQTSVSSAVVLFAAVIVALAWANSPWKEGYASLWHTPVVLRLGSRSIERDLHFWVNDGLMTLFFLVVGLEIKREVVTGELRAWRAAALPAVAAVGGMLVPAMIYLAVAHGDAARGWGVPMATDIAFALGVLTLAAAYAPTPLKPLLLTLAIVDDIGAIIVIAVFYSRGVEMAPLVGALLTLGGVALMIRAHVRALGVYLLLGTLLWYLTYRAGIHPTIAGVALGLLTPAVPFQRPRAVSAEARRTADETTDRPDPADADAAWWLRLAWLSREAVSPLARVEHGLLPWTSFVILPLFALANAGVELSASTLRASATSVVVLGIVLGLVIGKPLGVLAMSAVTTRSGLARLPASVGWGDLTGMGVTAGVGFTMGLFIAQLAFPPGPRLEEAKIAILLASLLAGGLGYVVLRLAPNRGEDQSSASPRSASTST